MQIFKKNINLGIEKQNFELVNGAEFLFNRAMNSGIKNIFFDDNLTSVIPEKLNSLKVKIYSDLYLLWTAVYSLSMIHQRVMCLTYDQSFFNFIYLEKYFANNPNLNGGIVIFCVKKDGVKKFTPELKNIFPIYNYYKIDDFLESIPYYFELSEKLKLPVIVYINESVLNEFKFDEHKEYTQRTEKKQLLQLNNNSDNENENCSLELKQNYKYFSNIGKSVELFKGEVGNNLIFTDAGNFHWISENSELFENSDIILFNLLSPFDNDSIIDIIKNGCKTYYENIFIFDDYDILHYQFSKFFKNKQIDLKYGNLKLGSNKNNSGFCTDSFIPSNIGLDVSFCMGCNLFTFLNKLKDKKSGTEDFLIGDEYCFSLIKSSPLKFSFQNVLTTRDPIYFALNLNPKDLNKSLYVFISSQKLADQIGIFYNTLNKFKLNSRLKTTFIVYKSIDDYNFNINEVINSPLLKSFNRTVIKEGTRLKDMSSENTPALIFLKNNCENNTKADKNLNYLKYLFINNGICNKFECKLCYQQTKCPAIKINISENIIIDAAVCTVCNLCVDICPHNAIKLKKRKKIKIKKSLESKINIK